MFTAMLCRKLCFMSSFLVVLLFSFFDFRLNVEISLKDFYLFVSVVLSV